jgi:hypothetical protein
MCTPFAYGRLAKDSLFTDRKLETERLIANFNSTANTILISPRRWGKSSLVEKVADIMTNNDKNIRFVMIDLYNVRSEEEFYELLAKEILLASNSKLAEIKEKAGKFLGRLIPKMSFGTEPNSDFNISFDWEALKQNPDDILNLAENISKEKDIRFVVCIDEFQNIAMFDDSLAFQKKLRSNWQKHKKTTYCLYGSKRHMMIDIFTSQSMPFYKFGDIVFLQKIEKDELVRFIIKRFKATGKKIDKASAELITNNAECHPYYVQQLAHLAWLNTKTDCNIEIVELAQETLLRQLDFLFQTITDELSNTQINFLKALINNVEQFSANETIIKYNLGTSANVLRIKKSLENREIIDLFGEKITLLDPMYRYWLGKVYFGRRK